MQEGSCVYLLFYAISFVPPPVPLGTWHTHIHIQGQKHALPAGHTYAHPMCAHIRVYIRWTEKTRCQLQNWSCLVGEGEPGRLPARAASRQCAFLKTLRRAGLGEWLFKTLGSFYFTTMEVNSALKCQSKWSHLVSVGSLCIRAVEVRPDGSRKVQLSCSFFQLKLIPQRIWRLGFINFFSLKRH